ncbi:paraslipin [Oculatella sp. FACHB-28]|uniref:SPFH domain-containing protein n=1 Tax=Cyanophyceae TaxID=3028117 RepID=UPI001684B19B|nr:MULTISPECIES: stomatin-like protein [Cyanophyceae]MBD1997419.1 paraslipin [Leptolyngbya sp. FACHB-541]MBD2055345.1 paraslipin [Oculatella sp. FACHB-28]
MQSILAALALLIIGYTVGSVKIINQGNEALVERLGRYHRKLMPGLNFIVPLLDTIVWEDTTREQVLDIDPQEAITKDNITLLVDAVMYWRILELQQTYYAVEDISKALMNLVITSLRSEIGRMELEQTYASRSQINQILLQQLDEATATWGVKVTRIEVQNITLPETVRESLELERAAESKKRAAILEAEGEKQAAISEAEGTVQSIELISNALKSQNNTHAVLQYLVAQKYVDANYRLGQSNNSKIIFMDPKALTEAMSELIVPEPIIEPDTNGSNGNGGSGNGSSPS